MISFFIAAATLITLVFNPVFVAAETENRITGIIVLKEKAGETPLENLKVLLYSHGNEKSNVTQAETDKDGKFEFDNLVSEELSYYITAKYEGVSYGSDVVRFPGGAGSSKHIKLVTYNTLKDIKIIEVSEHSIVIDIDEHSKKFLVEETMILANESTSIYVGERDLPHDKKEVLRIKLPGKYNELKYLKGLNVNSSFVSDSGILDTTPFKPGNKKIAFKYEMPFNIPKQEFVWVTYFQTEKLKLSFKNNGLSMNSKGLLFDGISFYTPKEKDGKRGAYFKNMTGFDMAPGTAFSVTVSGFSKKEKDIRPIAALLYIVLLFVACRRIGKPQSSQRPQRKGREQEIK